MYTATNTVKFNEFMTSINARATRRMDASITMGVLELQFVQETIKIQLDPTLREINKNVMVDIERILHTFIGDTLTQRMLHDIANKIEPLARKITYTG